MSSLEPGITVHCRVRNEERFVRSALLSVLPLARRLTLRIMEVSLGLNTKIFLLKSFYYIKARIKNGNP